MDAVGLAFETVLLWLKKIVFTIFNIPSAEHPQAFWILELLFISVAVSVFFYGIKVIRSFCE